MNLSYQLSSLFDEKSWGSAADFSIKLNGVSSLVADDFIL